MRPYAKNDERYPVCEMPWYHNPRFSRLLQALKHSADVGEQKPLVICDDDNEPLPSRIQNKVAQLLYISPEDINVTQPVNSYGIDSLSAAGLRSWLFKTFGVNVPQLTLLYPTMTVERLAEDVLREHTETESIENGH